jgi:Na+-translocating ferredoxin:NAD+ oxidoreductase subunit B
LEINIGKDDKALEELEIYKNLQKHLNEQPIGFPTTESGAEIPLLRRFFSPREASLAMYLSYKPQSIAAIHEAAKGLNMSLSEIETILDTMMKNGAIGHLEREGERYFYNHPLVVGIYEWQLNKLNPDMLADMGAYTSQPDFGREFLSTKIPQMRTIPVRQSITTQSHIITYNNITEIITANEGPIVILECICRKVAGMRDETCKRTQRLETCMALGDWAKNVIRADMGRVIRKEEALEIMKQNEADGLILQPSNTQKVEFVCSCCGCCCGMLNIYKKLPNPVEFWATDYNAVINPEKCNSCGTCLERCQMNAIRLDGVTGEVTINRDRCLGCGNCVASCPSEAIQLAKKEQETVPPQDTEALYEKILAVKKRSAA